MRKLSRRKMLELSGLATGGILSILSMQDLYAQKKSLKLKVIVAGAHPDDPETGCGGTMLKLSQQGHDVIALYLTRGEAGIANTSFERASEIRTKEAKEACKIMGVKPLFVGQIDGNTKITQEYYKNIRDIIENENPDIVFTHWPIDSHRDHRITSNLVLDAWVELNKSFELYYYEVYTGEQTQNFNPTNYVDISSVENIKRKVCFSHKSQNPQEIYNYHQKMSQFRGMEYNCKHAEAFVNQVQNRKFILQ